MNKIVIILYCLTILNGDQSIIDNSEELSEEAKDIPEIIKWYNPNMNLSLNILLIETLDLREIIFVQSKSVEFRHLESIE